MGAGNAYTPTRVGFVGDAHTPANETANSVFVSVSDTRDNPMTPNRSGVCIYNTILPPEVEVLKKIY